MNGGKAVKTLLTIAVTAMAVCGCAATDPAARVGSDTPSYVNVRVVDGPVQTHREGAGEDPNEILCKRAPITGSRLKRMVCATRAEWELARQEAEQDMREIRGQNAAKIMRN